MSAAEWLDDVRAQAVALISGVVEAGDRQASTDALAAILGSEDSLETLRVLAAEDAGAWAACMARLGGVKGLHASARRLDKLVAKRPKLRVAGEREELELPRCVPDGWKIPHGWHVDHRGIWQVKIDGEGERLERVATASIWVTGRLVDADTGAHAYELAWPSWDGRYTTHVVQATDAMDARKLVGLAHDGAPVTSVNASALVHYLDDSQAANSGIIPAGLTASRMGWFRGGFLLGDRWYGSQENPVQWRGDEDTSRIVVEYGCRGTWEGWLWVVEHLGTCDSAWLAVYAPVASILLEYLNISDGSTVDWSSETTGGKTTILRLAASVVGNPGRIIQKWNTSAAGIEGYCSLLRNLPPLLDDTKNAPKKENVANILYMQSGGTGKLRGKPGTRGQGVGLRSTETWRSVALSTGEERATSFTADAGARARTLCLVGDPLDSREQADAIAAVTSEHYGHLLPRVLERLVGNAGERKRLIESYKQARKSHGDRLVRHSPVAGRLGDIVALLEVARDVVHACGVPHPPAGADPIRYAHANAVKGGQDADRPRDALEAVWAWAATHQSWFWGRHDEDKERPPGLGWVGSWSDNELWDAILLKPEALNVAMSSGGVREDQVSGIVERWMERGWMMTTKGRNKITRRVDGLPVRMYAIRRDALVEAGIVEDWS